MKTNVQQKFCLLACSLAVIVVFTMTSCRKDQVAAPKQNAQSSAQNSALSDSGRIYQWLVGEEPLEGPDMSVSDNGDTITMSGSGYFNLADYSITGDGWYVHTTKDGAHHQKGTWKVLKLVSFDRYHHADPPLPSNYYGGLAIVRIEMSPNSGKPSVNATLRIYCVILGSDPPPGTEEGIRLYTPGRNYTEQVFGQTLFIRQ